MEKKCMIRTKNFPYDYIVNCVGDSLTVSTGPNSALKFSSKFKAEEYLKDADLEKDYEVVFE